MRFLGLPHTHLPDRAENRFYATLRDPRESGFRLIAYPYPQGSTMEPITPRDATISGLTSEQLSEWVSRVKLKARSRGPSAIIAAVRPYNGEVRCSVREFAEGDYYDYEVVAGIYTAGASDDAIRDDLDVAAAEVLATIERPVQRVIPRRIPLLETEYSDEDAEPKLKKYEIDPAAVAGKIVVASVVPAY